MHRQEWRRGTQKCVRYALTNECKVGWPPWSVADAYVGLLLVWSMLEVAGPGDPRWSLDIQAHGKSETCPT